MSHPDSAPELVDVAFGSVRMIRADRDQIFDAYKARQLSVAKHGGYYAWADFVREIFLAGTQR